LPNATVFGNQFSDLCLLAHQPEVHQTRKLACHRAVPIAASLALSLSKAKLAGITRVADVTGLDNIGIPVVMVVRPSSRSITVSQGKGLTLDNAFVSGLMESLEALHAERPALPVYLMQSREISADDSIDISALPCRIGSLFRPDLRIAWTEATDIKTGKSRLVPFELVHMDYTLPFPEGSGCFAMSSSGLASGNFLAEALIHGICELIERDALALASATNWNDMKTIPIGSIPWSGASELVKMVQSAGCTLALYDLTTDIGVPVIAAFLSGGSVSLSTASTAGGLGCHPDPGWACIRAITEAAQSRLTRLAGSRDDIRAEDYDLKAGSPSFVNSDVSVGDLPLSCSYQSLEADLREIMKRLSACGLHNVYAVDLSRAEIGVPVVRVIIPGLEPAPESGTKTGARAERARTCMTRVYCL